jgi:hypothetical protein
MRLATRYKVLKHLQFTDPANDAGDQVDFYTESQMLVTRINTGRAEGNVVEPSRDQVRSARPAGNVA